MHSGVEFFYVVLVIVAMVLAQIYGHMYTLHYSTSRQLPQLERQQKIRSMRWMVNGVMAAGLVILLSFWRIQ